MSTQTTHPGELSLSKLLSSLTATLDPRTYVFTTHPFSSPLPPFSASTSMYFREAEGITTICTLEHAQEQGYAYSFPCRKITLDVESSLDAVGFIAVVATRLAKEGMGVNPVSGYFHDHLFVPVGREGDALGVIERLADECKRDGLRA